MSQNQLVSAYVRGDISRRTFVRRSVALGVSLGAALTYADLLGRTDTARASHNGPEDCEPFYEGMPGGPPKEAHTLEAIQVRHDRATLVGFVKRDETPGTYWFHYGKTASYGRETARRGGPFNAEDEVHAPIFGLEPETTYHFRLYARNYVGCIHAPEDVTFTTLEAPPDHDPDDDGGTDEDYYENEGSGDANGAAPAAAVIAGAPAAFGALAPRARRLLLDVDGLTTNLVTARRRRRLGIEVTCSEPATVRVTATITALVRRIGRRPVARTVQIAAASIRFPEGDTKQAQLTISRRGVRLLARRSRVTVTLVATAVATGDSVPWRTVRGTAVLAHPRRRRR